MNKKILNKIRHKFSVRIVTNPCIECPFCLVPNSKNGFYTCDNPYVGALSKKFGNASLIKCPDTFNPKKCKYLIYTLKKLKPDFDLMKKYIRKYRDGKWILVKSNHFKKLSEKMVVSNSEYIVKLLLYFGYIEVKSPKMDSQITADKYENMSLKNVKRTIKREMGITLKELKKKKKDALIQMLVDQEAERIAEKTVEGRLFTNDWTEIRARYLFGR